LRALTIAEDLFFFSVIFGGFDGFIDELAVSSNLSDF
jgi:hypothetical protein